MNIVTPGVVLFRRTYGEYGRMAALYTRDLGRVTARLAGVDRPQGKLKVFAEPMICAEYRLYMRPGSAWTTVTGGRIVDCYPGLRLNLDRMLGGLEMCELLLRLTPEHSPSPQKYELITDFLSAYSESGSSWLPLAFGLRLLEHLGLGPDEAGVRAGDREIYRRLMSAPIEEVSGMAMDTNCLYRLRGFLFYTAEAYLQRPFNSPRVRASIETPLEVMA